jgi:EAL domain-containing protein (putative c-di-GMP-specific phosphodiesterase class I)
MLMAERLRHEVSRPILVGGHELTVTTSVGVMLTRDGGAAVDSLVADADVAMYQAKEAGKNRCAVFEETVRSQMQDRLVLVGDLRRAVTSELLSVAFQPIVELSNDHVVGAEALLRWHHPTRGSVPPNEVIPVAEETGLIDAVGLWVLRQACHQLAGWQREFGSKAPGYVSVNVSGRQLQRPDFPDLVEAALKEAGLSGDGLCLELTESVLMSDVSSTLATMHRLRDLGIRLAIDDFGTGYSSLAYLKRFPVELLKVDRSFVANLAANGGNGEDAAIVSMVVALADALGVAVVAEGVETAEQMAGLRDLGCALAQGYLLGRPARADDLSSRFRRTLVASSEG